MCSMLPKREVASWTLFGTFLYVSQEKEKLVAMAMACFSWFSDLANELGLHDFCDLLWMLFPTMHLGLSHICPFIYTCKTSSRESSLKFRGDSLTN